MFICSTTLRILAGGEQRGKVEELVGETSRRACAVPAYELFVNLYDSPPPARNTSLNIANSLSLFAVTER